ncbi:sensor histidine kinase [Faecalimonas sp.]
MNKKKWFAFICLCIAVDIGICVFLGRAKEKEINGWIYKMTEKILETEDKQGVTNVLKKYGVEEREFHPVSITIEVACIGLINGILFLGISLYDRKQQDKKIWQMEQYCEEILAGKETLQLTDNEEGSFSLLNNKVYDITMLLRENNAFLEKSKFELEQFLADISHQLKTPITSLHMVNELLRMDLPQEQKELFLDNMQKDLMKIEWLVKGILNLAKLDSGTVILKKEEIYIKDLLKEVQGRFAVLCEVTGSRICGEGEKKAKLWCDFHWTKESVCNIVKNAIEHGATEVKFCWEENYIYTKLSIKDNGEGIESEDLPHIFERFYKSKNAKEDSVGLGLAFTKSIVKHQGGDIDVRSQKEKGTEFILKFYQESL